MSNDVQEACQEFLKRAGVTFKNPRFLTTAFTHRSYINEVHRDGGATSVTNLAGKHNERLEFLGDAVLELVVTDHLFMTYPAAHEGDLTAFRAALVNATFLGSVAERLGMNDCLLLSKGEAKDTGRARATILANTFEAVVGALYLDQGYDAVRTFIERHVLAETESVVKSGVWRDAKSSFQEYAQATWGETPRYEVVSSVGPDHDKQFIVEVVVGQKRLAKGEGKSKQEAEQSAAERALKNNRA